MSTPEPTETPDAPVDNEGDGLTDECEAELGTDPSPSYGSEPMLKDRPTRKKCRFLIN